MLNKKTAFAFAVAGLFMLPTIATADLIVVNTGTPTGTSPPVILSSAQSLAAEFKVSAGETIDTLSAYLTTNVNTAPGDTFIFDIYQTLPTTSNRNPPLLYSTSAQWKQNGWNSATAHWTAATTGDYWLVLKDTSSGRNSYSFDAPPLASSSTGNPPALGFDFAGTSGFFSAATTGPTFGVEITGTVPEPSALALALGWPVFLGPLLRRRKASPIQRP